MSRFRIVALLADLIEVLESEPYLFSGHYWSEKAPDGRKPIDFKCEFTHDTKAVVADWRGGAFEARVLFESGTTDRYPLQLFIRGFGHLRGEASFSDGNVLLSARSETARAFGHACFDDRKTITMAGTLEANGDRLVYCLNGSVGRTPASIANIRPLPKRA